MFDGEDFKCLHVLPALLGDTSKKGFDGEDLASAKIKNITGEKGKGS